MKSTKFQKLASLLLAAIMVLAMAAPALAADPGSITITNSGTDGTTANGRTFNAYQILTVTLAADNTPAYAVPAALLPWYTTRFSLTADDLSTPAKTNAAVVAGIAALTSANDIEAFAKEALTEAKAAGVAPIAINGNDKKAVPYGYYVIEDTTVGLTDEQAVSAVMVDTTMPDVTIKLKAESNTIDKVIETSSTTTAKTDDASVGDTINYKVTGKVPDMTGYVKYAYHITDTISKGLTFDPDSVKVSVNGVDTTNFEVSNEGTNPDGSITYRIILKNFIQYKDAAFVGKPIVVTYSATVNENAVIGSAGNANEAKLIFSNDPSGSHEGDPDDPDDLPPVGESPKTRTKTYVTGIDLLKVDDKDNRLVGAQFTIEGTTVNKVVVIKEIYTVDGTGSYWLLKNGTYTTDDPATPGMDLTQYVDTSIKYTKSTVVDVQEKAVVIKVTGEVGSDGMLTFDGLSEGTYTITEIKAPDGYNILTSPITVVIGVTLPTDEQFKLGNDTATWNVSPNASVQSDGSILIKVVNQKGSELPSTGGMGTTLFTIGGLVLMAGVLLLALRRRSGATK